MKDPNVMLHRDLSGGSPADTWVTDGHNNNNNNNNTSESMGTDGHHNNNNNNNNNNNKGSRGMGEVAPLYGVDSALVLTNPGVQ